MLNLLRNKSQLYLFAPEPLSVTVLSRKKARKYELQRRTVVRRDKVQVLF